MYRNHLYIEGTTIAAYSQQVYLFDREVEQVRGTPLDEKAKVYKVLASLTQHSIISIKSKVIEYFTSIEKEDFPASRDEVLEKLLPLLLKSRTVELLQSCQGFQREDGKFEVFQFSSTRKFTGMKVN